VCLCCTVCDAPSGVRWQWQPCACTRQACSYKHNHTTAWKINCCSGLCLHCPRHMSHVHHSLCIPPAPNCCGNYSTTGSQPGIHKHRLCPQPLTLLRLAVASYCFCHCCFRCLMAVPATL
jgi:hypothetical protein